LGVVPALRSFLSRALPAPAAEATGCSILPIGAALADARGIRRRSGQWPFPCDPWEGRGSVPDRPSFPDP
jgi:hypothetical protein